MLEDIRSLANARSTFGRGDVLVVRFLDSTLFNNLTVHELDEELEDFLDRYHPHKLIIDFGPVARCSTARCSTARCSTAQCLRARFLTVQYLTAQA